MIKVFKGPNQIFSIIKGHPIIHANKSGVVQQTHHPIHPTLTDARYVRVVEIRHCTLGLDIERGRRRVDPTNGDLLLIAS